MNKNKLLSFFIAGGVFFTTLHAIEFDTVKQTGFSSGKYVDLDNDGDMDLIAEKSDAEIIIVEQLADGTFSEKGTLSLTSDGTTSLADINVGDLNNDGKLDILTAGRLNSAAPNMVFMNENTNGLTFNSTADNLSSTNNLSLYAWKTATGDFNGDGKLDAIWSTSGEIYILFGAGDGTFSSTQFKEIPYIHTSIRPIVSDIDSDGDLDIIIGSAKSWNKSYTGAAYILLNNGTGTFSELKIENVPEYDNVNPMALNVGDFNNDGKEDFIFSNSAQLNSVDKQGVVLALRTSADGETPTYSYSEIPTGVTNYAAFIDVADVNNDGWDDVVFSLANQGMKIFLNNKDNTFSTAHTFDGSFYKSELKDINGDGLIDVISYSRYYLQLANISLSSENIDENKEINTTIGTLSSSGMTPALTYSILCSTPGVDDSNFVISENTLKSSVSFDYENKSSYTICVKVTGSDTKTFEKNLTITVSDVNEAPTANDLNITMDEDTSKTFGMAEATAINFQDPDVTYVGSMYITTLPTKGTLTLSDTNVTLNQNLAFEQIGSLVYTPLENGNGTPYDSLGFKVNDGEANSTSEYTVTINVTPVNDTATITSTPITSIDEDSNYSYTLGESDIEEDKLTWNVHNDTTLPDWLDLTIVPQWEYVGDAGFSATGIDRTSMVIDSKGTPYIAYKDDDDKANVMKYNGTSWIQVGDAGFSAGKTNFTSMALDSNDTPYVVYQDYANNHNVSVMKFDGTSWVQVGDPGFGIIAYYTKIAFDSNNAPYVVYTTYGSSKVSVMKYNGNSWEYVGGQEFSASSADYTSIVIDKSGTLYVSYRDRDSYNAIVMKYNGNSWEEIVTGISSDTIFNISLAIDNSGVLYVAYAADVDDATYLDSPKASVMKYNGNSWELVGDSGFSAGGVSFLSMALDSNSSPYVFYSDDKNNAKASVMKYDGSSWVQVGSTGFSAGITEQNAIAIDAKDTPYVLYMDNSRSNKASVMTLEHPTILFGTPTNDDVGDHNISIVLSDGINNVDHNFTITVVNVNDIPTSQDTNITMDEDTSITFELDDFNFADVDKGAALSSIIISMPPNLGSLKLGDVEVGYYQEILDVNISSLTYTPVANGYGKPYTSFYFKVNDGEANSKNEYKFTINVNNIAELVPSSTPTPIPDADSGQLVDSNADELETPLSLDGVNDTEESLELTFTNKEDGTQTKIAIPKLEDKTINTIYSSDAIEFKMIDAIASYNNNGTTEHSISVDNKETVAISYIPGAKVEFREDDGVQTSVEFESQDAKKSDILIVATKEGYSENSITNSNGVLTKADSTILGTQTVIDENGTITVDTPVVVSSLENNITTTSKLDADGNLIVNALKVSKDGTTEETLDLGSYPAGSQVNVEFIDGAVVVEVITTLGTESFTLRNGRK